MFIKVFNDLKTKKKQERQRNCLSVFEHFVGVALKGLM